MAGFYTDLPTTSVSLIRASQHAHVWRWIIQTVLKQMSYPYVMIYTCKDALFTVSVIGRAQILNWNNADTCKVQYVNNKVSFDINFINLILL